MVMGPDESERELLQAGLLFQAMGRLRQYHAFERLPVNCKDVARAIDILERVREYHLHAARELERVA